MSISVNDDPVKVFDFTKGETLPNEILLALADPNVEKLAFNASFERIASSTYIRRCIPDIFMGYGDKGDCVGNYLSPEDWKCSMVWSAYLGFLLSVEDFGKALKLAEQKMSEGRELIRYFCVPCKPTKSNGGRTRNMLFDATQKWEMFKTYNRRDVEAEMSIQKRLSTYPVPESVWDEYRISEKVNDRGVMIDR